jgi:hypothetical protein
MMAEGTKKIRLTIEMEVNEEYFEKSLIKIGEDIQTGMFQKKLIEGNETDVVQIDAKLEVW